mmetsp:Transcript_12858/g.24433  ORF Transcript_12858/g.24433 Transcript_12858/m.24433 type:complete len:106 (-) Transcript_12858:109-426(-)
MPSVMGENCRGELEGSCVLPGARVACGVLGGTLARLAEGDGDPPDERWATGEDTGGARGGDTTSVGTSLLDRSTLTFRLDRRGEGWTGEELGSVIFDIGADSWER